MVSKEPKFFKSFIESFIMTSFVLRLPFRVIDSTAYSGDLWYSFKSCSVWCFLFVTLFNLQGTRPSGRNIAILTGLPSFVNCFFHLFQDFFQFHQASCRTALLDYHPLPYFVNTFFRFFSSFLDYPYIQPFPGNTSVQNAKQTGQNSLTVL